MRATDNDFVRMMAAIFAGCVSRAGMPTQQPNLLEALAPVLGYEDEGALYGDRAVLDQILAASRAMDASAFLPPSEPDRVRLLHSVISRDEPGADMVELILRQGLRADPAGKSKSSESPHSVFFVATNPDAPRERYNRHVPWITVDIPDDWEGWGGAVGAYGRYGDGKSWEKFKLYERPRPGGVVAVYNSVPAEFIVGVNGVTPKEYRDGLKFWDEHVRLGPR
jgi:hypothetical protein